MHMNSCRSALAVTSGHLGALCTLLAFMSSLIGSTSGRAAPTTPQGAAGQFAGARLSPIALDQDKRLQRLVTIDGPSVTLRELCQRLGETELVLTASETLAARRVTCFATKTPVVLLMKAVADVFDLSWRETRSSGTGYELYQTSEQLQAERADLARSERRSLAASAARHQAMEDTIRRNMNGENGQDPLRGMLALLSRDGVSRLAELASKPIGVVSAGDNRHLHDRVMGLVPFTKLPDGIQTALRSSLRELDPAKVALPFQNHEDLADSQVGFVTSEGGVRLGVVGPDGRDVWVFPQGGVYRTGLPGIDRDDDRDPEAADAQPGTSPLYLYKLPAGLRSKRLLSFPRELDRSNLANCLKSVADQTGIPIVSDDYLQSSLTYFTWVLTDKERYSLAEALEQIAGTFTHRFIYRDGVMRVQTRSRGLDLRSEPSPNLIARLRMLALTRSAVTLDDCLQMCRLSDLQLMTLTTRGARLLKDGRIQSVARNVNDVRDPLRLFDQLSAEQRAASVREGLPASSLTDSQRRVLQQLGNEGLGSWMQGDAPEGIYVESVRTNGKLRRFIIRFVCRVPLGTRVREWTLGLA